MHREETETRGAMGLAAGHGAAGEGAGVTQPHPGTRHPSLPLLPSCLVPGPARRQPSADRSSVKDGWAPERRAPRLQKDRSARPRRAVCGGAHAVRRRAVLSPQPQAARDGHSLCVFLAPPSRAGRPIPRASPDPRYSFTRIERALPAGPDERWGIISCGPRRLRGHLSAVLAPPGLAAPAQPSAPGQEEPQPQPR